MITAPTRKLVVSLLASGILTLPSIASSATVTVDGNLADLLAAQGTNPAAPFNWASGTDPVGNGDSPGTDIKDTYAYYDNTSDTFYLGMNFYGPVGTSGGVEGGFLTPCIQPAGPVNFGIANTFDACEDYSIRMDINNDSSFELDFTIQGDAIIDSGPGTEHITGPNINTNGVIVNWAVSEFFDGVEFSVTGFENLLNPMSPTNPRDISILFHANTSLTNLGENTVALNIQVVPIPAAVWLFGSGLIGLVGFAAKRQG